MSWYDLIDKNGTAVIPDGTVEIPANVYSHCGTLKSVILPNSVRVIGRHAFDSCGSLESAVLPDGLVEVGDYAFRLCHCLHIPRIPDPVVKIGDGAFDSCKLPESLAFTNVIEIGGAAFNQCWGLRCITIPAETRTIGTFAFSARTARYLLPDAGILSYRTASRLLPNVHSGDARLLKGSTFLTQLRRIAMMHSISV